LEKIQLYNLLNIDGDDFLTAACKHHNTRLISSLLEREEFKNNFDLIASNLSCHNHEVTKLLLSHLDKNNHRTTLHMHSALSSCVESFSGASLDVKTKRLVSYFEFVEQVLSECKEFITDVQNYQFDGVPFVHFFFLKMEYFDTSDNALLQTLSEKNLHMMKFFIDLGFDPHA
jgi:ankyrin repeat protein